MAGSESANYRLVVFRAPDTPESARELFAKSLKMHPLDASRLVAHMPGILPGLYNGAQCKTILDGLFEMKVAAEARLADQFPDFSRPKQVHDMLLTAGGVNIRDLVHKQTLHFLPWDQIGLIAAGRVELPDVVTEYTPPGMTRAVVHGVRRMLGGGALNRKERTVHSPVAPKGEAILWRKRPHGVFRLSEDKLRYEILGEHLATTAAENYPRLLRWLASGTKEAFLSKGTEAYVENKLDDVPIFDDFNALTENATMELLRSWYRADREKAGGGQ
jgi:hypothetical protein